MPGRGFLRGYSLRRSGRRGKVYAVDISPGFLKHIAAEAAKRGQKQVVTVVGNQDSTNLPRASVDLVFLCDVYHHLETPARNLSSIRRALRENGRLVVIDFDRVEGKSTEFVLKHVRASKDVFRQEIEAAGFRLLPMAKLPPLDETFFLRFEKATSRPRDIEIALTMRGQKISHRASCHNQFLSRPDDMPCWRCRFDGLLAANFGPNLDERLCFRVAPREPAFFQCIGAPAPSLAPLDRPFGHDASIGERMKNGRRSTGL